MSLGAALLQTMGAKWSPAELSPAMWWSAKDLTLSNGDPVSFVPDRSGNGRDLTLIGTSAARPLYAAAGINGFPSLDFDGDDDILETASTLTLAQPFTIAAVASRDSTGAKYLVRGHLGDIPALQCTTGTDAGPRLVTSAGNAQNSATNVIPVGDPGMWMGVYAGVSSVLRANNSEIGVSAGSDGFSDERVGVGRPATAWDGDVGEVIIFPSALTLDERDLVWAYLSSEWGLS